MTGSGMDERSEFPFLFGGTFIEGSAPRDPPPCQPFPFLFGGTFIEGDLND